MKKTKTKSASKSLKTHDIKAAPFWIAIIGLLVSLTTLSIIIARALLKGIPPNSDPNMTYQGWLGLLWFDNLQTFTILGNSLVLAFWLVYLFALNTPVFEDNRFILYTCSYISMVGLMYWVILIPVQGTNAGALPELSYLTHGVTPIIFLTFTIVSVFYNKKTWAGLNAKQGAHIDYWKFLGFGVIFPVIYVSYLIGINFIPIPDYVFNIGNGNKLMSSYEASGGHNYISVYGSITNFNPKCLAKESTADGTIIYNPDKTGSWMNLLYVMFIVLLIPGVQAILVFFNNYFIARKSNRVSSKRK